MADMLTVAKVRNALGDSGDPPAWTDAELATRLDQAGGLFAVTVEGCLLELQGEAAGRFDYTLGSSTNAVAGIFNQLNILVGIWKTKADQERALLDRSSTDAAPPTAIPVEVWF